MATVLNDERIGSAFDKKENHQVWIERYQNAPAITETAGAAGQGFTTSKDPQFTDKLRSREDELARADRPQDRERLGLILNAERAACGIDPEGKKENLSQHHVREHMGKLVEYDNKHGHPITDLSRDLQKQPYTAKEQVEWLERGNRQKTSQEFEDGHKNGWNDVRVHHPQKQDAQAKAQSSEWHIAPHVRERQEQQVDNQKSQNQTQARQNTTELKQTLKIDD